jgi:hypothetical protein
MKRQALMNGRTLLRAFGALLVAPAVALAQSSAPALRDGVVVDTAANSAFVTTPGGAINAIDLTTGSSRWSSGAAVKPLVVADDTLVAQAAPSGNEQLVVVTMDKGSGAQKTRSQVALPNDLKAAVGDSPSQKTLVQGLVSGSSVLVSWAIQTRIARGVAPDNGGGETVTGAARLDPDTGAAVAVSSAAADSGGLSSLTLAQMVQLASADGQHVVKSEAGSAPGLYRWVVSTAAGASIGAVELPVSVAPFVVSGTRLFYVASPSGSRNASGRLVIEPLRLRCMDLGSGAQLWAVPVMDAGSVMPPP